MGPKEGQLFCFRRLTYTRKAQSVPNCPPTRGRSQGPATAGERYCPRPCAARALSLHVAVTNWLLHRSPAAPNGYKGWVFPTYETVIFVSVSYGHHGQSQDCRVCALCRRQIHKVLITHHPILPLLKRLCDIDLLLMPCNIHFVVT